MKPFSSLSLLLGVSLVVSGANLASAQQGKQALRILPVGDQPPFIQEQDPAGRVRLQQPPPPGALPPEQVALTNEKGGQIGEPLRLNLGSISRVLPVSSGSVPLHEVQNGAITPKAFHTLKTSQATANLAILWRDPKKKQWPHALSLTLRDDVASFGAGKVRLVNVSGGPVRVVVEAKGKKRENFTLPRGKILKRDGTSKVEVQIKIQNKWKRVYAAIPLANKNQRANLVIYSADGIARNRFNPVKVLVARDRAANPKVPKPRN